MLYTNSPILPKKMERVSHSAFEALHIICSCQPLLNNVFVVIDLKPLQVYTLILIDVMGKELDVEGETLILLPEDYVRTNLIKIFKRTPSNVSVLLDELKTEEYIDERKLSSDDKQKHFKQIGNRRTALYLKPAGKMKIDIALTEFRGLKKMISDPGMAKVIFTTPIDSRIGRIAKAISIFLGGQ